MVTPHRGRSRPSSRAPSIAETPASPIETEHVEGVNEEEEEVQNDDDEEEEEEFSPAHESLRASPSTSMNPLPMPLSASHLSASSPSDLYASLANAATPPNNMFLSTLADSSALHLSGMNHANHHIHHTVPVSGGGSALGTPMSLDAAMEHVERPNVESRTSAEASRSGSVSGGEETDRDLEGEVVEGEADDGETERSGPGSSRENVNVPAVGESSEGGTGIEDRGKGKEKEIVVTPASPTTTRELSDGVKKLSVGGSELEDGPGLSA